MPILHPSGETQVSWCKGTWGQKRECPQSPSSAQLLWNATDGQPSVWGVRTVLVKWGCRKSGRRKWGVEQWRAASSVCKWAHRILLYTAGLADVWWGAISLPTPCGFCDISDSCAFAALPGFPMLKLGLFFFFWVAVFTGSCSSVQMLFSWNMLELDVFVMAYPSIILVGTGQEIPQLLK